MNEHERLLALDAAAEAAELCSNPAIRSAVHQLQKELDKHFSGNAKPDNFCDFLEDQKAAVIKLSTLPEIFGH